MQKSLPGHAILVAIIAVSVALMPRLALADDLDPAQIKAALHTASDEEGGFIDRSVAMVNAGTMPRELFTSTFLWARKKSKHKFQYFQRALTQRASDQGIAVK